MHKVLVVCILALFIAAPSFLQIHTISPMNEHVVQAQEVTEEPTEEVTEEPTDEATPEVTEEATAEVTEEPTEEVTEEPAPEVTEEPTEEVTEEPAPEVTEEPTEEVTEEPTAEVTEEPTEEATAEPTAEVTEEPTEEATAEPTAEVTEEPTAEITDEPTAEATPEMTEEATTEPTAATPTEEPTTEPTAATPTEEPTIELNFIGSTAAMSVTLDTYIVSYVENVDNGDGTSTWTYNVAEDTGATDLTSWTLQVPTCATVSNASGDYEIVETTVDGELVDVIQWNVMPTFTSDDFTLTLDGTVVEGTTRVSTTGTEETVGEIDGPVCETASTETPVTLGEYDITYQGVTENADETTTWTYLVEEQTGATDLTNWTLQVPTCATVSDASGDYEIVETTVDGELVDVIQWNVTPAFTSEEFTLTLEGDAVESTTRVSATGTEETVGEIAGPVCDDLIATDTVELSNGYVISYIENVDNGDGTSTWTYQVEETAEAQDLSNWVLGMPGCTVANATPETNEIVQTEPNTGLSGIKWETGAGFTSGEFTVTIDSVPEEDQVTVAAKGPDVAYGQLIGPVCDDSDTTVVIGESYEFTFIGIVTNIDGSITIRYNVTELDDLEALLAWRLNLGQCVSAIRSNRNFNIIRTGGSPAGEIEGIEWDLEDDFDEDEFTITLSGPVTLGFNQIVVPGKGSQALFAPVCPIVVNPPGGGGGGGGDDDDEPADISIEAPEVEIEVVNDITFVVLILDIINSEDAGNADEAILRIDLEDFLELDNLTFLDGAGYVKSIEDGQVLIGVGMGDVVKTGKNVRLRLRLQIDTEVLNVGAFPLNLTLIYNDDEDRELLIPVEVVLPGFELDDAVQGIVIQRLPLDQIDVRFRGRWNEGGLRLYGFPLTEPIELDNGIIVQYFERARFEYHPELAGTEFEVLLGLLSVELGYTEPPVAPPEDEDELAWYFVPTGHLIAPPFRDFWVNQGGLLTFGYPISEVIETEDGLLVQYFERVRLEYHPENEGTEFEILLGFLGEESLIIFLTDEEMDDMDEEEPIEEEIDEEIGDDDEDAGEDEEPTEEPTAEPTEEPTPTVEDDEDDNDDN